MPSATDAPVAFGAVEALGLSPVDLVGLGFTGSFTA